jgi:hypothetical protein
MHPRVYNIGAMLEMSALFSKVPKIFRRQLNATRVTQLPRIYRSTGVLLEDLRSFGSLGPYRILNAGGVLIH